MKKAYAYKKIGDVFQILEDGQHLKTPKGADVNTDDEKLAKILIDELKEGKSYGSASSILSYHYTYCEIVQKQSWSIEDLRKSLMNEFDLINDDFLMFRQTSAVKAAIASAMEDELVQLFEKCTIRQLVAILVLASPYCSIMLPAYLIWDIVNPLTENKDDCNCSDLLQQFIFDIKHYFIELEDGEGDDNEEELDEWLKRLRTAIEMFIIYFG